MFDERERERDRDRERDREREFISEREGGRLFIDLESAARPVRRRAVKQNQGSLHQTGQNV